MYWERCVRYLITIFFSPILYTPQVAITVDYRYQPGAGELIDAGKLVSDTRKVGDYRYQLSLPCCPASLTLAIWGSNPQYRWARI
jgi:hypothetical protein